MNPSHSNPLRIFLLGLPGSGKSTVGKDLAQLLQIPFVDLDAEIERAEGASIKEIFASRKEAYFREAESRELKRMCGENKSWVMATGGGTPCFHDNMHWIKTSGRSIFLDVPPAVIALRIRQAAQADRPLFAGITQDELKDKIEWMRTHRLMYYQQADVTLTGEAITADAIWRKIRTEDPG